MQRVRRETLSAVHNEMDGGEWGQHSGASRARAKRD